MRPKVLRRILMLGSTVVAVLGPAAPAQASTTASATFSGLMTTSTGFGTCANRPCPIVISTKSDPKGAPLVNVTPGGNTGTVGFIQTACAMAVENVDKPGKAAEETGTCVLDFDGIMTGFCEVSTGLLVGTLTGPFGVGVPQTYAFSLKFTHIMGVVTITGRVVKGASAGNITGVAEMTPVTAISGGGVCLNKTNTTFRFDGSLLIKITN